MLIEKNQIEVAISLLEKNGTTIIPESAKEVTVFLKTENIICSHFSINYMVVNFKERIISFKQIGDFETGSTEIIALDGKRKNACWKVDEETRLH